MDLDDVEQTSLTCKPGDVRKGTLEVAARQCLHFWLAVSALWLAVSACVSWFQNSPNHFQRAPPVYPLAAASSPSCCLLAGWKKGTLQRLGVGIWLDSFVAACTAYKQEQAAYKQESWIWLINSMAAHSCGSRDLHKLFGLSKLDPKKLLVWPNCQ